MAYMYFTCDECGNWNIYDSISGERIKYIFYSKREAEKEHRRKFNLQGKHFVKIG